MTSPQNLPRPSAKGLRCGLPRITWRPLTFIAVMAFSLPCNGLELVVPDDRGSIAAALSAVTGTPNATVIVKPGIYEEPVSLPSNVVLKGEETARTFLRITETAPAITAPGTKNSRISNFTFIGSGGRPAVWVTAGSNVLIGSNVFSLANTDTAILVEASSPNIEHNVFFGNGTALSTGGNLFTIRNNAFVGNTETLSPAPVDESAIANNGFFTNIDESTFGVFPITTAPLFSDQVGLDFHLQADSPYIDAGSGTNDVVDDTTPDIGAYGGAHADGIPVPVDTPTVKSTDTSITLSWPAINWYLLGGYRLYYDRDSSGPPYNGSDTAEGSSPIDVGDVTSFTLTGLPPAVAPGTPILALPEPLNGALKLSWSSVPAATGYTIQYGVASATEHAIDVGNVTAYTLTGLQNGTTYRVTVTAYSRARYFLAISAYASFASMTEGALSPEVTTAIGPLVPGTPSNAVSDFPETIVHYPNLPDKNGCFIATAAYGHYSAGEVQLLRTFRDRYLLTNAPGRAFVAWYYRHSPAWAQSLEANDWAKPAVRMALLPAIGFAGFILNTTTELKWVLLVVLFTLLSLRHSLRRRSA